MNEQSCLKNFLAIDTSGDYLCVAARKNGKIFSAFEPDCAMKHSTLLMTKVDEVLKAADLSLEECNAFAACVGAGSFTGIRIGISAVKGFALACKKPLLGVTSFEIAAYNALSAGSEKVLAIVDAMHGFYYACGFENGKIAIEPCYISETEVLALEKDGYLLCACKQVPIMEKVSVEITNPLKGLCGAVDVKLQQMQEPQSGENQLLQALYIRKSSAEENLAKEQGK
jgi:tRNA threonylcarbamoyl adenosine modification protein YeaZ